MSSPAVAFEGVSKRFMLRHQRPRSFQEALIALAQRRNGSREEFWALRDITFSVAPGETLGIMGPNGSGKSTILKLVAGIIQPTQGVVTVNGRVAALLELGAGFHPDLTGRENIYLNGALLGYRRKEVQRVFDDIVAFAELAQFLDTPVRHYSSGMYLRLGFAVAVHLAPEILLVDEALAVGDAAFQQKCLERMRRFQREGRTILFVSHDVGLVRGFCHRFLVLDKGQQAAQGQVEELERWLGASQ